MSSQYNGLPTNLATYVPAPPLNIASSTHATPIVVTTSGAHGLTNGDVVAIYGHQTNVAANGFWAVFVLSPTTFQLLTSVGTGTGTNTGIVQPATDGPTFPIPSDGDDFSAAAFNGAYEALGDRTAFSLYYTLGLVEWSMLKRAPAPVVFTGGAYSANPGVASNFQIGAQSVGSTVTLEIASFPALDGMTMTFTISPDNVNPISFTNEGQSNTSATFHGGGGVIKFRYTAGGAFSLWKVIESSYSFGVSFTAGTNYLTLGPGPIY